MVPKKMFRHIMCQGIFQLIIMILLIFYGEKLMPEAVDAFDQIVEDLSAKYYRGVVGATVRGDRFYFITGGSDYFDVLDKYHTYSRHFTFIFNTFVMLQVFNLVNSRKPHEEVLSFLK
jgi:Ca2+ transporting ATPase